MKDALKNLINSIDEAKEKLSEAEDARDSFLEPILVVLEATGGGVSHCSIEQDRLHIVRTGSCRGSRWDDSYTFPLAIFTCEDPLTAAAEYVAAKKKAEDDTERRNKLATVRRLQKELEI